MLISDLAMRELQWHRDSFSTSFALALARLVRPLTMLGRHGSVAGSSSGQALAIGSAAYKGVAQRTGDASPRPSRLEERLFTPPVMLATTTRHARLAAVRGLFNARSGDYEAARLAFAEAARDGAQDLTALPGFWSLPRAGQTAAVLAYEDVGRPGDATSLADQLRASLGPLAPRPTGDTAPRLERRHAALGH